VSLLWFAAATLAVVGTTGCSGIGSAAFPDAATNPAQVPLGTIQGSVYGGHAPLVGAHVYVLTPNQTGYGLQATSLLSATYQTNGGYPATEYSTRINNTGDPNIPSSWFYETTDSTGAYNISGDYTCTAGYPIYLYAYGGTPTYPAADNAFAIDTINVESRGGSSGAYTYTILFHVDQGTINPTENFYAGEPITLTGFTGNYAFLNGTSAYVTSNSLLTTTTFEVSATIALAQANPATTETFTSSATTELPAGSQAAPGAATVTPGFNPGVVNLAVLGVCPSTGSLSTGGTLFNGTTSKPIQYVYMNEVSTAAAAYALEGFTPAAPTATTNATFVGTSANNLIGLQNAFLSAAQLYDINGSQITTSYAGEGHIANPKTPAGNGSVPQNLLDTMGNILAACVDSNNTSTIDGNAGESAQCKTLFETATSNGVPTASVAASTSGAVIPVDTAQAMINIAHYPAGSPTYTSTFMRALYGLPTGNAPFTPNLASAGAGQPNDFTVAIQYPKTFATNSKITSATTLSGNPASNGPESIALDSYGNVWVNDLSSPYEIFELNPLGVLAYTSTASTHKLGYITIDPDNNVYSGSNYSQGDEIEVLASGTANLASTRTIYTYTGNYGGTTAPYNADGFYNGYMSVALPDGNVFIGSAPPGQTTDAATEYTLGLTGSMNLTGLPSSTSSFALTSLFTPVSMGTAAGSVGNHGVVENASATTAAPSSAGDVWWTNEVYAGSNYTVFAINRVNASGTPVTGFPIKYASNNAVDRPEMPAIDQAGNLWAAARLSNTLLEVTPSGTVTTYTGPALNGPFGVAIDGANNLFVAAATGSSPSSIAEFSINNTTTLSPTTSNYTLSGQLATPLNMSMDQSGNLWITTNTTGNTIVEWIGAGAPSYNPLSLASKNNALSTQP